MAVRLVLLMLLAIPASFGSLYCEFGHHFCDWKSITGCDFTLMTDRLLDGETGYLLADANSCQPSQISQDVLNQEGPFKFRLKYLLSGPGPARLSVEAQYTMSENKVLWSTDETGNSSWNHHDIVAYRGMIDLLESISIKAYTSGSSTVAIGSISKIESFPITTESNEVYNWSTILFTPTDSNFVNRSTEAYMKSTLPRITLYLIVVAVALVTIIIISGTIFCIVRD